MTSVDFYTNNHTELVANTPAAIGNGPGTKVARIVVTATITGDLALWDNATAASGSLLYLETTPAAGVVRELRIRAKKGIWCVPGTGGTCSVYWD